MNPNPKRGCAENRLFVLNLSTNSRHTTMTGNGSRYIAALDVGTTTIRCQIINHLTDTVGAAYSTVKLHYPKPGYVEIVPDELLKDILDVVKLAVKDANISFADIESLGISTQRATFITWKKNTGEYLHNLITWKDLRAIQYTKEVNSALSTNVVRWTAYMIYLVSRNMKFGMGSNLKFFSSHVSVRLLWVLANIKEVKEAFENNNLMFGTLETWLVYKLTGGETYVTDISNASATGFYDPFDLDWGIVAKLLKIPTNILPKVVNNDYDFGMTRKDFFGVPLKIGCVMADQSSSMFGSCCFFKNDIKITMGTGAFLDVNTLDRIHPSLNGMYPLVGWKLKDTMIYMSEVSCSDAGSLIEWLLSIGFIENPSQTSDMAYKVEDNNGVYFIPAFSGLGPPINNEKAATGFMGIKPTTTKEHMVRAVLESIAYRLTLSYNQLKKERSANYKSISVDGGVSKNNFVCQLLADLTNLPIQRQTSEMSVVGVAFLAGLSCGMWKNKQELYDLRKVEQTFSPSNSEVYKEKCRQDLYKWVEAAERFKSWYE